MKNKRVSVFCASSSKVNETFLQASEELAVALVNNGCITQYGGGRVGLMGALADTVMKMKGQIIGFIPQFMVDEGWVHPEVTDMRIVPDMQERKRQIMFHTDAIVALPGGCGTLEELTEAITLKQLGLITVPIIIVNTNKFYDPLIRLFVSMVEENLLRMEHQQLWTVVEDIKGVIPAIENSGDWDSGVARSIAAI